MIGSLQGEICLWWGIFIASASIAQGAQWTGSVILWFELFSKTVFAHRILSPAFTSAILLFLSGIPLLEEKVNNSCCECLMLHFSNNRTNKRLKTLFLTIEPTLRRTTSSATIRPMWSSSSAPHHSSCSPLPFTRPSPICYRWPPIIFFLSPTSNVLSASAAVSFPSTTSLLRRGESWPETMWRRGRWVNLVEKLMEISNLFQLLLFKGHRQSTLSEERCVQFQKWSHYHTNWTVPSLLHVLNTYICQPWINVFSVHIFHFSKELMKGIFSHAPPALKCKSCWVSYFSFRNDDLSGPANNLF